MWGTPMAVVGRVVLVANDDPAHRYIACRTLRNANFTTIEARWGREVVQLARRLRPDIILLDMHMPDQSGIVTVQQLRAASCTASIPVVFLTASAHLPLDQSQAEELGVSAHLFSPVEPDTLVAVVEGSIMRALGAKKPDRNFREALTVLVRNAFANVLPRLTHRG